MSEQTNITTYGLDFYSNETHTANDIFYFVIMVTLFN